MIHDFFLTEWFFYVLRWLYGVFGNSYFLTILAVTLVLRLVQIFPDIQSRKTQKKQAEIQPQIDKLKEKYSNDPQKLNQEQNKLMRENGIGCLSGCLPMLLTLPLFFCFLAAFRFWGYEQTVKLTYETIVNETRAEQTYESFRFGWITNIWQPDSGLAPVVTPAKTVAAYGSNQSLFACFKKQDTTTSKIGNLVILHDGYTDFDGNFVSGEEIWRTFTESGLAKGEYGTEQMLLLSDEASQQKYDELMQVYKKGYNNGWFILPILAAAFQFLLAWFSQKQQKKANPAASAQQNMNFMMYLFPIMSIVFCMTSTSAFALYWVLSSVLQIGSSTLINYLMNKKEKPAEIVQK
ncbi:MAG: membrane protein insertase YidC [Clostridia bacterium]|nr:membrane protein insertase YidC [Clostridia bacterium]MBR4636359.1 membrane protein insertase YidC [Clostridia bacterium]